MIWAFRLLSDELHLFHLSYWCVLLVMASVSVLLPVEEPAAFLSCMQVANRSLKIVVEIAFAAGADKMQFSLP